MRLELRSERRDDGIVDLWLDNPQRSVIVLDQWLLDQLNLFFDKLEQHEPPTGLAVLSANARAFIAGADLAEINDLSDEQLRAYLIEGTEAFARLAELPCPTVAVINGAALGGGLELALHCDGLVASRIGNDGSPFRLGLPEASLGLCSGWGGTQMLPARIDPAIAIEMAALGTTVKITDAPEGLFDRVVDSADDLYETAIRWLEAHPGPVERTRPKCIEASNRDDVQAGLDAIRETLPDRPAVNAVLEAVEVGIAEGWSAGLAAERRLLVSLRHTEFARAKIEEFFARKA
jgi:enoyl-CoA hydratase/carnithine racemase